MDDDPLTMTGGIVREEIGKVTLMEQGNDTVAPATVMAAAPPNASAEEEEAVEMADPIPLLCPESDSEDELEYVGLLGLAPLEIDKFVCLHYM